MNENILEVHDLKVHFRSYEDVIKAVDGISFNVQKGKVFGLVGESGSGKTMTALSILRLIPPSGRIENGSILFNGIDLLARDENFLRGIRGFKVSMVFQEPAAALNPVFTIGYQMVEAITAHGERKDKTKAKEKALEFLKRVHIPDPTKVFYDYPHQLSGGTKQRVMIAAALLNSPELLILDEPTTALDVTIQAQILDLLDEIIESQKISILFVSHDFGIIARMCDEVAVMYKGKIVESGAKNQILSNPRENYTISLLESVRALQ